MTEDRRIGISALKMVSGMEHQVIDSSKASFSLIPGLMQLDALPRLK